MTHKHYTVVRMPKDGLFEWDKKAIDEANSFTDYNEAFDCFNNILAEEGAQLYKQPKGEPPLRASLRYEIIELWVITRTDNLIK